MTLHSIGRFGWQRVGVVAGMVGIWAVLGIVGTLLVTALSSRPVANSNRPTIAADASDQPTAPHRRGGQAHFAHNASQNEPAPDSIRTGAKMFPASRPESGPEFDFEAWVAAVAKIDHATWDRHHPGPYSGWFNGNSDDVAAKYFITWGPLGIRTRMHDHTWSNFQAFRRIWPPTLLDANGDLLFDCFEVVDVIPGSPAEGHLQKGDLLLAMDGGRFVTAGALRPDQPLWKFQDLRSLEVDAGERLDLAEGRGRIAFDVLRLPAGQPPSPLVPPEVVAVREAQASGEMRRALQEFELDAPVQAGEELTLLLELTRKHNGSCAAELIRPRLEGPAGVLDLSEVRRFSQASGWGGISRSVDHAGHERPVVLPEAREHEARMETAHGDPRALEAARELAREEHVRELRVRVRGEAHALSVARGDRREVEPAALVRAARGVHHARAGRPLQERRELVRQQEVGEVVQRERHLEAVGRQLALGEERARVVGEHVEPLEFLAEAGRDGAHVR